MQVQAYDDPAEYAARVVPLLIADEARHNLALSVVSSLVEGRLVPDRPPLLAVVSDGATEAAVLHTPPHGLLLTALPSGAAGAVVARVLAGGYHPTMVIGPPDATRDLSAAWTSRTGEPVTDVRRQGVYALTQLIPPPPPAAGVPRLATDADVDLVVEWLAAFAVELRLTPLVPRSTYAARIGTGQVHLWCVDDAPVSTAAVSARTPTGARIGPVYTPPEHRGRGYASAVTAAATLAALRSGARQCFLYTDLDNPTSNAIYRRLGYEWVCESNEVTFGPPSR